MPIENGIPILRIFDYRNTIEFLVDSLRFEVVSQQHFEENTPA